MPYVNPNTFGRRARLDGRKGWEEVVPTTEGFKEPDGSDVRIKRVREYGPDGELVRIYLEDPMCQMFVDDTRIKDDPEYLRSLKPSGKERF